VSEEKGGGLNLPTRSLSRVAREGGIAWSIAYHQNHPPPPRGKVGMCRATLSGGGSWRGEIEGK